MIRIPFHRRIAVSAALASLSNPTRRRFIMRGALLLCAIAGLLRWDISVFSADVNWTPAGVDNRASTLSNWSQTPNPGDALSFGNNAAGVFDVRMDLQLYQLDQITFTVPAPAYTLRLSSFIGYDLTGFGIKNDSALAHTFILESHQDESSSTDGGAASMQFHGSATASNSTFEVHGGFRVPQHFPADHYDQFSGAQIDFFSSSTAANATFNIQGAAGDGAPGIYAQVNFRDTSSAGMATVNNQPGRSGQALSGLIVAGFGGQTNFYNNASAANATVNNIGQSAEYAGGTGGITNFHDFSTAGSAGFHNLGATAGGSGIGVGGSTQFFDHSSAGNATLTHATLTNEASTLPNGGGNTYFGDDATAGNALIDNLTINSSNGPGKTGFYLRSSAGTATIYNRGLGGGGMGGVSAVTSFHDDSTASSATIRNFPGPDTGGRTEFYDRSSAGLATITLEPGNAGGTIKFYDNSTAGSAHLDAGADGTNGLIAFQGQSTAANAVINVGSGSVNGLNLIFNDGASAGSATITVGHGNIQFYNTSTAANANITMSSNSSLAFTGSFGVAPTAANAAIHLLGGSNAGFSNNATAADSTFIIEGADANNPTFPGFVVFSGNADAGNSTITLKTSPVPGGTGATLYMNNGTGPGARLIMEPATSFYAWYTSTTAIGSVEGAGTIILGDQLLTVGALGLNTTFSGPITGFAGTGSLTKVGTGQFTLTGTSNYGGGTTVNAGTLVVNGSILGPVVVNSGATLKGTGTIGGLVTVNSGGTFSPGNSPGKLTVGALTLASGSQTNIELGATQYDQVAVAGQLTLGGTLNVILYNGFQPAAGNSFHIFDSGTQSGAFSSLQLPALGGALGWNTSQFYMTGTLSAGDIGFLRGDWNRDGQVTSLDIPAMLTALTDLSNYASTNSLSPTQLAAIGDFDNSGSVTNRDIQGLLNLVASQGGGSVAAVPEPATLVLLFLATAGWRLRRRRAA